MFDPGGHWPIIGCPDFNHILLQDFGYYSKFPSIARFVEDNILYGRLKVMEVGFGVIALSCGVFDSLALQVVQDTDLQSWQDCLVVLSDKVSKSGEGGKGLEDVKDPTF